MPIRKREVKHYQIHKKKQESSEFIARREEGDKI